MRLLYTLGLSFISILAVGQFSPMPKQLSSVEDQREIQKFEEYHFASPSDYNLHQVNLEKLFTKEKNNRLGIDLVDHNGSMHRYEVIEVQNMAPELSAKFPMIKSYRGHSTKNKNEKIHITVNDQAIIARSLGHKENFYIQPVWNTKVHAVSSVKNTSKNFDAPICLVDDKQSNKPTKDFDGAKNLNSAVVSLRTYRVAIVTNGEYSDLNGGTKGSVLTSIVGHLNLVNEVFQREVGIKHILVANNDELIFLDKLTDPFDNDEKVDMMRDNTGIINGIIGSAAYDIGHIFSQGGGGVANLAVPCGAAKGRGQSGLSGNANFFKIVSHEMGHQFNAGHTWSFCTTELNTNQRSSASASEPGSGSTIMSYAGLCGGANVQGDDDPYYNAISIEQIKDFAFSGRGNLCALDLPTSNNEPTSAINYENGFFIPISTPFVLRGTASDADLDNLTYNWDEVDFGPASPLGSLSGNSPAFRSMVPDDNPERIFPKLSDILNNVTTNRSEILPDYDRDLTFRFLVRDNNNEAGATVWEEVSFKTSDTAGPFTITDKPDNADYLAGVSQSIKWDVANTDNPIINCQTVNIILSKDGGMTFTDTLSKNSPNDGLEYVTFPAGISTSARIKVEASDNIFFDISDSDFNIVEPANPDFSLSVDNTSFNLCSSDQAVITINNIPVLGFTESIVLMVTGDLPTGVSATFNNSTVAPNGSAILTVNNLDMVSPGIYNVTVEASATGGTTQSFDLQLKIIDANINSPNLTGPNDGQIRVPLATNTSWSGVTGASAFQYQLATDPNFNNIVIDSNGIVLPSLTLNELDVNQLYYWRVRSTNQCANSAYSQTQTFYSKNQFCNRYEKQQTLVIKDDVTSQVVSTINIDSTFTIQNFNIPYIRGTHSFVGDIELVLQPPSGSNRTLISRICDDSQDIDIGFDDEAISLPSCPINDGQTYLPQENLGLLSGANGKGLYILFIKDQKEDAGGEFQEWALEFCDDINPEKPNLLTNEQLVLEPVTEKAISTSELQVTDADSDDANISFIVMTTPNMGDLKINGSMATIGSTFTQADVAAGNVVYSNSNGSDNTSDAFDFIVTDNAGGLIEQTTFAILLDANVATIKILDDNSISIAPNPSDGNLNIEIKNKNIIIRKIKIYNLQGQEVYNRIMTGNYNTDKIEINANYLISGMYQISLFTKDAVITRKMIIY